MNLAYAVDRLYDGGWLPSHSEDLETLPDGRTFPSIFAVQREFAGAGLELAIKHDCQFGIRGAEVDADDEFFHRKGEVGLE